MDAGLLCWHGEGYGTRVGTKGWKVKQPQIASLLWQLSITVSLSLCVVNYCALHFTLN